MKEEGRWEGGAAGKEWERESKVVRRPREAGEEVAEGSRVEIMVCAVSEGEEEWR